MLVSDQIFDPLHQLLKILLWCEMRLRGHAQGKNYHTDSK